MNNINQKNYLEISDYEKFEDMFFLRTVELHQKYGDDYYSMPIYKIKPNRIFGNNAVTAKYKEFVTKYSTLFQNPSNSLFILNELLMIYNSEIFEKRDKDDKSGYSEYEHILNDEEKTALLERTFNMLKFFDNRDDILESFLRNTISRDLKEADKRKKMWYYLLNDTSFMDGILSFSDFRKENPEYDEERDPVSRYEKNKHLYEKYNTDVLEEKVNSFLVRESQSR